MLRIREILSSENYFNSRLIINSNFSELANALNNLFNYIDIKNKGAANFSSLIIKKYSNPTNFVIFDCEASGKIRGNLNVLGDSILEKDLTIFQNFFVNGSVNFENSTTGPNVFENKLNTSERLGNSHLQLHSSVVLVTPSQTNIIDINALPVIALEANLFDTAVFSTSALIRKARYIYLNLTSLNPTLINTLILPPVTAVTPGQIIRIGFSNIPSSTIAPGYNLEIKTTNLAPEYSSNIVIASSNPTIITSSPSLDINNTNLLKVWIEFYAHNTGWKVLNAHKEINF